MREVCPKIWTWDWFSKPHGYDFHGTLVVHEEGNLCIDPVEPLEDELNGLAREGVARILITNRNHARLITRRWVVALGLMVVAFYLPMFVELGWWLVALMAFIVLVPIFVLGPLIRGVDFSSMIPGKRNEND